MSQSLVEKYPHLSFEKNWKLDEEAYFLLGQCDAIVKAINNTPIMPGHYQELMNVALVKGAQATTAIEGNTLTETDIKKIVSGASMPPSKEYQEIEVRNILEAFNQLRDEVVFQDSSKLLSKDLLLRFNQMVGKDLGDHFSGIPGRLRDQNVTVGPYRAPDYSDVPELIVKFCEWSRREFRFEGAKQSFAEIVIQAIVSHVYIEWIHPFSDGNGRTGRLVEFYILLRGGNPDIASHILSNHYNQTRSEYYRYIDASTKERSLSKFIKYALVGFRDGLEQTMQIIQNGNILSFWQKLIYDRFNDVQMIKKEVFKRQRSLALAFPLGKDVPLSEIPELSTRLARMYANVSDRTVNRDIKKLIDLELIVKTKSGYIANIELLHGMIAKRKTK